MFYRCEHYMSISHMALIVAIVQTDQPANQPGIYYVLPGI